MHIGNVQALQEAYTRAIAKAATEKPEDYLLDGHTPEAYAAKVAAKIVRALVTQGPLHVNRDTPAFRAACRAVNVKNTNAALRAWLELP